MTAPDDASRGRSLFSHFLVRAALGICAQTPPGVARAIASLLGAAEYRFRPTRRAAVLANLAQIARSGHPKLTHRSDRERTARSVFRSYHRFVAEFFAQRSLTRARWNDFFRFQGMDRLYEAVASGKGVVITAPHLGNWELGGLALARLGFRVHVVTGTQIHPIVHAAIRSLKEESGIAVSTPEDGFLPLLETLRNGGLVVLLADGDVYRRGLPAPFFGASIPFPAGPALLARRSGAPLLHAHAARTPRGHQISFDALDFPDRALSLRRDLVRLTGRMAAEQERNIAAHVAQWCIFRPFFQPPRSDVQEHAA